MKKVLTVVAVFMFLFAVSSFAGWQYAGIFHPDTTVATGWNYTAATHGVAVDPDGKVWMHQYYSFTRDSVLVPISTRPSKHQYITAVYVFNRDGSQAPFSPIKFLTVNGVTDTLGGFTDINVTPAVWRTQQGVGMNTDQDGNIIVDMRSFMYRIDYKTGEGMARIRHDEANNAGLAPGIAKEADGKIFMGYVLPGLPIKEFDKDFNYLGNAIESAPAYGRTLTCTPDGNTLIFPRYTLNAILVWSRPSEFDAFQAVPDTVMKGFACESATWHPTNGLLYLSAGSYTNKPNGWVSIPTNYTANTWYGIDVTDWSIKDEIHWNFGPEAKTNADSANQRPRGMAFSVTGDTAYCVVFDRGYVKTFVRSADTEVAVTFQIDMTVQDCYDKFDPAVDKVVIRGSFNGWAGEADECVPTAVPGIYSLTKMFPIADVGTTIEYKFVMMPGDRWESVANRTLVIPSSATVLDVVFYDNVTECLATKTANVTFQADVTDMLAKGFNPSTDKLYVFGGFNDWVYNEDWVTQPDLITPTLFSLTHAITAVPGTTFGWKYRGGPQENFADNGWEGGDNHTFVFDGNDLVLDAFKPNVVPVGKKLAQDVTVIFTVDVTDAKDCANFKPFPTVDGVYINGDFAAEGGWAGWTVADTTSLVKMYNDGTNGDAVAGDKIWTAQVLFAAGKAAAHFYKYGIYSQGYTDTLSIANGVMDNEAGMSMNHVINISDVAPVFVAPQDKFGSQYTGVEKLPSDVMPESFTLHANYPNPFNPTTTISYDLPVKSHIRLTVFNAMGQVVAKLVDAEQTPGSYRATWDGKNVSGAIVPSGIYFYRIEGEGFAKTMKMTLMK